MTFVSATEQRRRLIFSLNASYIKKKGRFSAPKSQSTSQNLKLFQKPKNSKLFFLGLIWRILSLTHGIFLLLLQYKTIYWKQNVFLLPPSPPSLLPIMPLHHNHHLSLSLSSFLLLFAGCLCWVFSFSVAAWRGLISPCIAPVIILYKYCIWQEQHELELNVRTPVKPSASGPNVLVSGHAYYLSFLTISLCVSILINKILKTETETETAWMVWSIISHL